MLRHFLPALAVCLTLGSVARAQDAQPPAYLAAIEGAATVARDGEVLQATENMPFVPGDRLRTENGRVQVMFPDGSAIEVDAYSEIECVSPTRVRLLAGTMDHLQRDVTRSTSAAYLPQELDMYGTALDQYGTWQYDTPYGYVWYPTVAPDWRPYYNGYWSPVRTYGWTWVGVDRWAWPTHHYGRWGYASNRWFWIPGRSWGPAWVSWATASDYVSWCPLGFDSRPVFALSVGYRNSWRGWTVLPRSNFGAHQYYVHRYAVEPGRIPMNTPFITHNTPPLPPARAVRMPFDGRPAAGGVAVPRQASVAGQPTALGRPQASVGSTRPPAASRQAPTTAPQQIDPRWSRNPQTGIQTHYGIAVPRTPDAPAAARPVAPESRPPAPQYRPAVPDGRAPNGYRIERMDPRVTTPSPAAPQPRAAAPYMTPAPTVAVPRVAPSHPASTPPAQATPQAAAPARSAPPARQGAPQGEAHPRADGGRPAESRRR